MLERSLGVLGRSLGMLGRSWGVLGRRLGMLGRSLGVLGCSLGVLGRSLDVLGLCLGVLGRSMCVLLLSLGVLEPTLMRQHQSTLHATPGMLPNYLCNSMCYAKLLESNIGTLVYISIYKVVQGASRSQEPLEVVGAPCQSSLPVQFASADPHALVRFKGLIRGMLGRSLDVLGRSLGVLGRSLGSLPCKCRSPCSGAM
jgi:hypothetical protein